MVGTDKTPDVFSLLVAGNYAILSEGRSVRRGRETGEKARYDLDRALTTRSMLLKPSISGKKRRRWVARRGVISAPFILAGRVWGARFGRDWRDREGRTDGGPE